MGNFWKTFTLVTWLHSISPSGHDCSASVCTLHHTFVKILVWFCVSILSVCTQWVKTVLRTKYNKNSEAQGSKFIISVKTFPRGPSALVTAII